MLKNNIIAKELNKNFILTYIVRYYKFFMLIKLYKKKQLKQKKIKIVESTR